MDCGILGEEMTSLSFDHGLDMDGSLPSILVLTTDEKVTIVFCVIPNVVITTYSLHAIPYSRTIDGTVCETKRQF